MPRPACGWAASASPPRASANPSTLPRLSHAYQAFATDHCPPIGRVGTAFNNPFHTASASRPPLPHTSSLRAVSVVDESPVAAFAAVFAARRHRSPLPLASIVDLGRWHPPLHADAHRVRGGRRRSGASAGASISADGWRRSSLAAAPTQAGSATGDPTPCLGGRSARAPCIVKCVCCRKRCAET